VRLRPGAGLRAHPARRRDQPRHPEDAVGAPGGDGGAAGDGRRHEPSPGTALLRARDAQPDRDGGHLPAPRGAARPLPVQGAARLPVRGGAGAHPGRDDGGRAAGGAPGTAARERRPARRGAQAPRPPGGGGRARLRPARMNLEYLKRLTLRVRRGMGDRPGDRRFPGRPEPAGIELEAYGAYVPGDDLRHLDWNAVARLDTLLVRRFTAERELVVHLLLDASASMAAPARDGKLAVARELALALAYVALGANDAVRIAVLSGDGATRVSPLLRQRGSLARAAALLAAVVP